MVLIPDEVAGFLNLPNRASFSVVCRLTESLTEMNTRNFALRKGLPVAETGSLTAICELSVLKIWMPQCFTTVWASMAFYEDSFAFLTHNFTKSFLLENEESILM
jgi:hypothetical protein